MEGDVEINSFKDELEEDDEREKTATLLSRFSPLICSDNDDDDDDIVSISDNLLLWSSK